MREIKFRGKHYSTGAWVYGDLHRHSTACGYVFINTEHDGTIQVKPETVGQFTGLKDKNGREIYEGDIVRCWKKHSHIDEARDELVEGYATAVIKANGWTFFFEVIKQDDPRGWFFYGPEADEFYGVCTDYETMEVIGNIYSNPELLGPTAREDGGK